MDNKELEQITNQVNKKAIHRKSTKKRNYLIATIFITLIIGIFAYRYYEEKKRVKELVNLMMSTDALRSYNKYIESGMSKDSLGDFKGAIEDYQLAKYIILEDENKFLAYYLCGLSKTCLEDYKGAIIEFNGAIRIDSTVSNSYRFRGICKFSSNDKNGACLDWSKAQELGNPYVKNIDKFCN